MVKKYILLSTLIVITIVLAICLLNYNRKQNYYYLESNDLYSKESTIIKGNIQRILKKNNNKSNVIFFKQLEEDNVRTMATTNFKKLDIPIYSGEIFKKNGKQALIGSEVPITETNGKVYYKYGNQKYQVIGYLGTEKDSLLSETVILNDITLFSDENEKLIIDGKNVRNKVNKWFDNDKVEIYSEGILNRKTNIDYVSPIISKFIVAMVILSCFTIAYLYKDFVNKENYIYELIGISKIRVYFEHLKKLSIMLILAFILSGCANKTVFITINYFDDFSVSVVIGIMIILFFTYFYWMEGGHKWKITIILKKI
ncbi:hypothetical protein [Carnobacterium maltaromaticum]|uniref:hypothetical protein n=1 Tax=Carnobacterium maltaromaticum TaxID=2751 RepID=UPI00295ECA10|nr:hypothetical protein [Carnobacterium maltaromaticum]